MFVDDAGRAREVMQGMRNAGYRFALDDFGVGYSGLGSLQRFQFEFVKVDRTFVHSIGIDQVGVTILDSLIDVAEKLGAGIVVEGVETEEQLRHLQERRVRFAQGWLFSTPLGIADLERFLAEPPKAAPAT